MELLVSSPRTTCNRFFHRRSKKVNPTTNNTIEALRGLIESIISVEKEKQGAKEDRKAEMAALKASKLPAKEMLLIYKEAQVEASDRDDAISKLRMAGELLGLPVYREQCAPMEGAQIDDQQRTLAKTGMERIAALDGEIKLLAQDIKDKYSQAKGMGFDAGVIRRLVDEKLNPEKYEARDELAGLVDNYKRNLGWIKEN